MGSAWAQGEGWALCQLLAGVSTLGSITVFGQEMEGFLQTQSWVQG